MTWLKAFTAGSKNVSKYEVTDDSGFLAIIDPNAYQSFVQADWTFAILQEHFRREMKDRHLLIWGTGMEHIWRIEVSVQPIKVSGFREAVGTIACSNGRLLLTNYDSLAMAAQFPDVRLPQRHEQDQVVQVTPGLYNCRVIQLSKPGGGKPFRERVNFYYEFIPTDKPAAPWTEIPWASD